MNSHQRQPLRLPEYDYALSGAYFVTIVTYQRQPLLGEIQADTVQLSGEGKIVQKSWADLPQHYPCMESIAFVVMPNHVHGIVLLKASSGPGVALGEIVRAFKAFSTRRINLIRQSPGMPVWQRNYYEHVVRSNKELERLFAYVEDNPRRWAEDQENQANHR